MKQPDEVLAGLDDLTRSRIQSFVALLQRWNERINLISSRDIAQIWTRHVGDSLQLLPLIDADGDAIDLGSGAGFPGILLAIASNRHFHLVEADKRKAAFLQECARVTGAPVTVHATRIQALQLPPAALITARALAPLETLLNWAFPLLTESGFCLFPKGQGVDAELTAAARQWHMRVERSASRTDPTATILRISAMRRVGPQPHG